MSNRVLAIIGFVIFTAAVLFELQEMNQHLEQLAAARPPVTRTPAVTPAPADRAANLETLIAASNHLDMIASIMRRTAIAEHPDLKPEIEYDRFVDSVATRKSNEKLGHPLVFGPLKQGFPDDFAALEARYLREHPGAKLPHD